MYILQDRRTWANLQLNNGKTEVQQCIAQCESSENHNFMLLHSAPFIG